MDSEHDCSDGRVPLHGAPGADPDPASRRPPDDLGEPPAGWRVRRDGIRHSRRVSSWAAAALLVGTGAGTVALAHQAFPSAAPAAGTSGGARTGTGAPARGAGRPAVTHSVATTSGSGVRVTTTTHTVNGKTVVTRVAHAPAYHDN
jgi:hypothetical protein